jgi:predicted Rossmann-fold nucleotide-binding protein
MKVTVFGSSSVKTPVKYMEIAHNLGEMIAMRGFTLVNGGGKDGCMGAMNRMLHFKALVFLKYSL